MIKMGNTYCDRFSSHFALKTIEKVFPDLLGTLQGSVRLGSGTNWVTYSRFANWGLWKKGTLCLT